MRKFVASDYYVTEVKVAEAVRRVIEVADPLAVVVFGSRARGEHRPDSDIDIAVILDVPEAETWKVIPDDIFRGLRLPVDLLPVAKERYDRFRPWINTVHQRIEKEGVWVYERGTKFERTDLIHQVC